MKLRMLVLWLLLAPGLAAATPEIQHWVLENGARVYYVHNPALAIVDIRLVFDAAAARDGERAGLARLTNAMLDQGSASLDAGEIARRFESVGARLSSGSARDMAWLHLRSLVEPKALSQGVETLALVTGRPDFPEDALTRLRAQMLVGLQAVRQQPAELAQRAMYAAIYGEHPYASPPDGTEQSLPGLSREDVREFYRRHYTPPNAVVAIAGDIDRAGAEAIAERLTADLPPGERPPPLPPVKGLDEPILVHVPFASGQTHILLAQPAIARASPDFYAFTVGNHLLGGGGLVSLLTTAMREERGLSYSTSSYFVPSSRPGPFVISTQVRNDSAGEALEVLREVFSELLRDGPEAEALQAAKLNLTGSFPLNLDSNRDIVGYLSSIGYYGLPLDYLDRYVSRIDAVTAEQVQQALRRHLDPATLATVLVGPEQAAEDAREPNG